VTIDRIYRCNLCYVHRPPEQLFGVRWDGDMRTPRQRPAREVEHHICADCVAGLRSFAGLSDPTTGQQEK
jgi:hypothetical protein